MTEPLTTAWRAARGLCALVAVLAATTTPARAQCEMCEDMAPPGISFSPSTSTTTMAALPVTITWQDDTQLTPSTRSITLNGVVITGSFSYSGSATTATSAGTVALQPGVNWLVAEIWDGAQNQAVDSVRLTLDSFVDVSPQERATLSSFEGAATMAYAPPPYVSLDHSRSVALHYASTHAQPRGLVQVDATDVTSTPPDVYSILLKKPDGSLVTFTNGASEIFYRGGAGITRLAVLFDAASYATGSHPFTVVVRKWRGGVKTAEQTRSVRVVVVNEAGNPVGWGWSVAGLARLVVQTDGVLLISGSGDTEWYPVSCPGCATYRGLPAQAATLAKEVGGTYTRRGADGSTWSFDAMGRLTKIEARGGLATTYGYTAAGSLSWVQDPAGHRMTLMYDAAGLLARISDPGGRVAVVGHTGRDLTSILDPDTVFALRPTYDAAHRMTHHLDRGGYRWDFGYDAFGRLASRQYPSVVVNGVSTRPVALSRSLEMALLPAGSTSLAAPAPRVLSGAVTTTSTDPAGRITTYTFDPRGNVSAILDPAGRLVQMQYNQAGRLSRSITASGDTVGYEYDVTGRDLLRTVDQRTGHTTVMTYTADGRLKSSVDGVSDQTLEYDRIFDQDGNDTGTLGEVVYIRRGSSANFVDYVGGTAGRPSRVYGPGTVIEYTYHPSGYQNLASAREGTDTAAIRHTHDAFGRVVSITDRLGHRTQYEYDRMNRVVRITNALGGVTTYRYGPIHLIGITDARGQAYDFTVNPLGWITARRDPRGLTETLTHDAVGNIVRHINRRGQTTAFVYDNDDRVVSRTADGKVTTYTYSPDGSLRTASNGESTDSVRVFPPSISNLSGGISQLAVTRRNGRRHALQTPMFPHGLRAAVYGVSSVGSDPNRYLGARYGWLTEDQTYRPVAVSSGTDWDGSTIYDFAPRALRITYVDSAGSMRMVLPTGDTILRSAHGVAYSDTAWNRRLAVYSIDDVIGRTVRRATAARDSARWYGYDALGRLTAQADSTISTYQSCAPDAGGLIKCETLESHQFRSQTLFSYDAVGNPASELGVVATGNRLTQFGAYTLEFDVDGNVTRKFRTASPTTFDQRLFWSTTGQLDSVRTITAGSPALVSFGYDGWGRRVRRTSPTGTVRFVYDGEMLVMETDSGGNKLAEYHYLPGSDRPYSMLRGGRMYYFLVDGPGNVVGVVDDGGNLVNEYRYSAWGLLEKAVEGVANPFLFTGRELDRETGLYFHRARYYDPEIRRFVSEDPIGLAGGVNPYVYAANDPVNKSDPSGRCFGFWYHGMWIPLGGVYACILDGIDSADALEDPDDGADGEEEDRTDPWYKEWTDQVKCSIKNCSHTIEDRRSEELFEEQLKRLARDAWDATARSMRNAAVESSAGMIRAFKKTGESFVRTWYGVSESTESIRDGGEIIAESMIRAFRHTTAVLAGVAVVGGTITSVAAGTTVTVTHGAGGSVIISGAQIVSSNVVVYSGDIEIGPDLERIRNGVKHAHPNDGTIFKNRAHPLTGVQLPTTADASYYTEWVVPTPGVNHAGPQRLVIGKGGEVYWTGDHYASFLRIQ